MIVLLFSCQCFLWHKFYYTVRRLEYEVALLQMCYKKTNMCLYFVVLIEILQFLYY